jgi:hypothetical protein
VYHWFELGPQTGEKLDYWARLSRVDCDQEVAATFTHTHPEMVSTYGAEPMELCTRHYNLATLEHLLQLQLDEGKSA